MNLHLTVVINDLLYCEPQTFAMSDKIVTLICLSGNLCPLGDSVKAVNKDISEFGELATC